MPDRLTWQYLAVVGGFALGLALVLRLLRERRRPSVTFAWLLAMVLLPYVGVPLFLLFYGRKVGRRAHGSLRRKAPLYPGGGRPPHEEAIGIEELLAGEGLPPPREGNRIELVLDGAEAWRRTLAAIASAREELSCATFLISGDEVGRTFVRALAERARAGVRVRLLVDALGCFGRSGRFLDPLREAGGSVGVFLPVLPTRRRWSANLRNHRKVLLVDRHLAVTGGRNVGDEYLGPAVLPPGAPNPRWIDTTVELEGPAVHDLCRVFANDWAFATGERLDPCAPPDSVAGSARVQVVASGPDVPGDPLSDVVLAAIAEARRRIWIVTPYFVPDEVLQRSLELQARMGRDVLLILPERSNHRFADLARNRFLEEIIEAGGRVRLVPDRMVHAKALLFDDFLAIVGSANLDQRSFFLNFESSLLLTSPPEIDVAAQKMSALAADARDHRPEPRGFVQRWAEDLSLLVSPLL